MSMQLELPDELVAIVQRRAAEEGRGLDDTVADLLRIGLAAASERAATAIPVDASMLEERKRIAGRFITGEWAVELAGITEGRVASRESARVRASAWRR